ncbi:MAG TPA: DinB family protein [Candidatus Limnocylindrales bacterium]|nr:DinB family protein [Candidatus Limnocylindrales bacterium]
MAWTAPDVPRTSTLTVGGEREILQSWLDFHRKTLLFKCAGLTADQLKLASAPPSNLTLLGLVRHMADVERWWFRLHSAGQELDHLYWSRDGGEPDFEEVAGADAEADYQTYLNEIKLADEAVADVSLDRTFTHRTRGNELSVRWAYVHMVEEYARHNGHADLIRERIDGRTGD